ncbi:MAG TPA: CDP-alcohol phosphatidyltransferase family protein [Acidimicrobiales bacterium]|nr:CDP-alcohol phosphatidyltransferase family protein [Acidimicrobiales bacterium]
MADPSETTLQRLARTTGGVVTPANALDVVAMAATWWAGPRLGTWRGYAVGAPSYFADLADGVIARRTGTVSRAGEMFDHIGDKPKIFWGAWHIWRMRLADRPLIATVAAYNVANAAVTAYDLLRNAEPQIFPDRRAKLAMLATATGMGIQVAGTNAARTHPRVGRALRVAGALSTYGGVAFLGVPTTLAYCRAARGGPGR